MPKHDWIPRLSFHGWSASMPVDQTDAVGRSVSFEWLGFMFEAAFGRRARHWRDDPSWVEFMREIRDLPLNEQHARLVARDAAHV